MLLNLYNLDILCHACVFVLRDNTKRSPWAHWWTHTHAHIYTYIQPKAISLFVCMRHKCKWRNVFFLITWAMDNAHLLSETLAKRWRSGCSCDISLHDWMERCKHAFNTTLQLMLDHIWPYWADFTALAQFGEAGRWRIYLTFTSAAFAAKCTEFVPEAIFLFALLNGRGRVRGFGAI